MPLSKHTCRKSEDAATTAQGALGRHEVTW